jgi:nucleotide-binding universal stress UspA family protein
MTTKGVVMKILLAVDGSPYTTRAAEFIGSHLNWFQGEPELHLIHVKPPVPSAHARAAVGHEALAAYYREEASTALALAEEVLRKLGVPYKSCYKVGDVANEIRDYAEKNGLDMIVMGSHGHGALANLVLGSVATKVMANTKLPVMIVR